MNIVNIDKSWKVIDGERLGSNPGGIFQSPDGKKYYIKFYQNDEQAKSEYASNRIFKLIGANVFEISLCRNKNEEFTNKHHDVDIGCVGIMSEWNPSVKNMGRKFEDFDRTQADHIARSFIAAILTENWDYIGPSYDNQVVDEHGKVFSVDHGGSFKFRAQGLSKDFHHGDISTHQSLQNIGSSKDVLSVIFHKHENILDDVLHHLNTITDDELRKIFNDSGMKSPATLAKNVSARIDGLLEKYDANNEK